VRPGLAARRSRRSVRAFRQFQNRPQVPGETVDGIIAIRGAGRPAKSRQVPCHDAVAPGEGTDGVGPFVGVHSPPVREDDRRRAGRAERLNVQFGAVWAAEAADLSTGGGYVLTHGSSPYHRDAR
jgi:hypothetical protein